MSDPTQEQPTAPGADNGPSPSAASDAPSENQATGAVEAPAETQAESAPAAEVAAAPAAEAVSAAGDAAPAAAGDAAPAAAAAAAAAGDAAPAAVEGTVPGDASDQTAESSGEPQTPDAEAATAAEGAAAGSDPASAGEAGPKKRRRRRRKKKPGGLEEGAEAGAEGGAQAGAEGAEPRGEKKEAGGVFARFFEGGHGARKHAFSAGEVIAGRVSSINEGAFAVDLFGKAVAYADLLEPREVPAPIPEATPEPVAAVAPAAQDGDTSADADAAAPVAAEPVAAEPVAEGSTDDAAQAAPAPAAEPTAEVEPTAEAAAAPAAETPQADAVTPEPVPATDAAVEATPEAAAQVEPTAATEADAATPVEAATPEAAVSATEAETPVGAVSAEEVVAAEVVAEEPPAAPLEPLTQGQIVRGRIGSVSESGHIVIVNRNIDRPAAKQTIRDAREAKQRVEGVVYGFNRGGFDVLVEGIRVFCPARSMSLVPIENPEEFLGVKAQFTVAPQKGSGSGFVVSRRGILERESRKAAKALFKSLQPGQNLKGRVTQVREFGIFVDIGGVEGLVHQSEVSYSRGVRPADAAKPGDMVDVQVLKVGDGPTRKDKEKISLSMKALAADPWDQYPDLLKAGTIHEAKVVRLTDFGAFLELVPQIEGLLHISELGRDVKHASAKLSEGETVHVILERLDRKQRRLSLSKLSAAEVALIKEGKGPDPDAKLPKPGKSVKVTVEKVEPQGVIVRVPGIFGKRGRGFIPNSEMGTERGTDHRRSHPTGLELEVKIIGTDRDGGLRCSKKALAFDEERKAVADYRKEAAKQGLGTFGDLLRSKLGDGGS